MSLPVVGDEKKSTLSWSLIGLHPVAKDVPVLADLHDRASSLPAPLNQSTTDLSFQDFFQSVVCIMSDQSADQSQRRPDERHALGCEGVDEGVLKDGQT